MNCEQCRQQLSEFLEGELRADVEQEMQIHVDSCPSCRDEADIFKRMDAMIRGLPRHAPSTETILKVSESIHKRTAPPTRTEFGPVLDMDELAEFLRVDKAMLATYLDQIPCFELSGKLLFRRKAVEDWIERRETCMMLQFNEPQMDSTIVPQYVMEGGPKWQI